MKKILFTIQWYPPRRSANSLCDNRIIQELLKTEKYEIHCLSYKTKEMPNEEIINGINIHRFSPGWYFDFYINSRKNQSKFGNLLNTFILRVKQILTVAIYPCYEPFLALKFARKAKKLQKKEKFDLVISEHNGFDTLFAGYELKKKNSDIKYIPIFWDALSGGFPAKYLPKRYGLYKKKKLENRILKISDKVIAMKSHEKLLTKLWKDTEDFKKITFLDIPYLVREDCISCSERTFMNPEKITFVFAGSITRRNPQYLIELLSRLPLDNMEFWIICDSRSFDEYNYLLKKNHFLKLHHYIPNQELSNVLLNADFLVNFGVNNPNAISAKIFEYMSYGKPIISTYYIDNEACLPYLKKYPLGLCIDERMTVEENVISLEKFIEKNLHKTVEFEGIKRMFPLNLPESYAKVIEGVLNTNE